MSHYPFEILVNAKTNMVVFLHFTSTNIKSRIFSCFCHKAVLNSYCRYTFARDIWLATRKLLHENLWKNVRVCFETYESLKLQHFRTEKRMSDETILNTK